MLTIFPVETDKDFETAKTLFAEYLDFLKEEFCEYADVPWLVQYYQDFEEEIDNLPDRYKQPEGSILLAKYNGQPAGCVGLREVSSGVCEMKRLYVRPKYRRKGIGTALCEALMDQAKKVGYTYMRLATALEVPKTLYKSIGFKGIEPYRDIPSEIKDVVFMELKLV